MVDTPVNLPALLRGLGLIGRRIEDPGVIDEDIDLLNAVLHCFHAFFYALQAPKLYFESYLKEKTLQIQFSGAIKFNSGRKIRP